MTKPFSNCDKTWIMTNLNVLEEKQIKKGLVVRTFWHLDNQWDVLWAVFCDSHDVFSVICEFS